MAITGTVSSAEITKQITDRWVGKYVECMLVNYSGDYTPGTTNDSTFKAAELAQGTAGYDRQTFKVVSSDVSTYAQESVGLARKTVIFTHDGGNTSFTFTHAALIWGTGNVVTLDAATQDPNTGTNGTYSNLPTTTDGSGKGATLDLTVASNVYTFTVNNAGTGYSASDSLTVSTATMIAAGALPTGSTEPSATIPIGTVHTNTEGGNIVGVVKTDAAVNVANGNQVSFYWDIKLFGLDGTN
jgi:hypothetical protein|tara:strand:+ start:979 stop:1704 length:726 start_codon:yes stop_codon:yes gene_type:complete